MLDQGGDILAAVLALIDQGGAQLGVAQALPAHRQRGQVPSRRARNAGVLIIFVAVAGGAAGIDEAQVVGPTHDILEMLVAVIALTGSIVAGMAIHAARMTQYSRHRRKQISRRGVSSRDERASGYRDRLTAYECAGQSKGGEDKSGEAKYGRVHGCPLRQRP